MQSLIDSIRKDYDEARAKRAKLLRHYDETAQELVEANRQVLNLYYAIKRLENINEY